MSNEAKCEKHGIFLDNFGVCQFCEDEKPTAVRPGVKIVGGGQKTGVKEFSKEGRKRGERN